MKALRYVPFLALGLTACPGDDGAANGTETATDATTAMTSPTTDPTTTGPTTTSPTTTDPTGETTSDPTDTESAEGESSSGSTTGEDLPCPYTPVDGEPDVALEEIAAGFDEALLVVGDPVDTDVLYVVQKGGEIKRIGPGDTAAPKENWLELPVFTFSESGLLGLAFHPDYADNGLMYVVHTPADGIMLVTEIPVADGMPDVGMARDVIGVSQPADNHNGGMVQFGPDGMLYLSVGDGGEQDDGCGHGQNGDVLLGKILRIDPAADGTDDMTPGCAGGPGQCDCDAAGPFDYTIPADNPFVGDAGIRDEIYALGFRNPWRMSFDPVDDRLWVGDVGQGDWEEVSVIEAGDNAGWGDMEGNHCFNDPDCDEAGLTGMLNADNLRQPVAEYAQGPACSVIGLGNYRSCEVPAWDGLYFYGDLCTGAVFAVAFDGTTVTNFDEPLADVPDSIYGGGYNAYGDVFIASASQQDGQGPIYRIAPAR
jgi:glucose/arabinose dehydrogenase